MGEEKQDVPSIKQDVDIADKARNAFMEDFEATHENFDKSADRSVEQEDNTDSKESDTEETAVTESQSDSSSVKEEKKVDQKKEQAVDKTAELLQNKEKALHEEREKRKQANLKLRELQRQLDEKKDLEKKLEQLASKPVDSEESESDDPSVKQLQQRLKALESEKQVQEQKRIQEEAVARQRELQQSINATDKQLKDEGFPGFRYAVNRVDEILKQMYADGEIEESDYMDPNQWKSVYKDKVYSEISSEFKALQKQEVINDKKEKKKQAAKVSAYPGSRPQVQASEDEDEVETDSLQDYLKFKTDNAAKRNIS